MGLLAFCEDGSARGFGWMLLLHVLEDFLHLIQLVAQLGELHVDLAEFQVGVLLGGYSHFRQAPVFLACGQLGSRLPAEGKLPTPLEDRVREQATDDQDDDDEGDSDRATHDSPLNLARCPPSGSWPRP